MTFPSKPPSYARLAIGFLACLQMATLILLIVAYTQLQRTMDFAQQATTRASQAASAATEANARASEAAHDARAAACLALNQRDVIGQPTPRTDCAEFVAPPR